MITTDKKNLVMKCVERGYLLNSVMDCVVQQNGDMWTIDIDHPSYPKSIHPGVGSELKKLLSYMGIKSAPNCSCNHRAATMNANGIEWCKNNIGVILDWLKEESEKRKLPFIRFGAKKIVELAIRRAEKNVQPV
tara:strand:- start:6437 stop:6838 length:402 start_codon:yes stop_codon:yes gene_type:complete